MIPAWMIADIKRKDDDNVTHIDGSVYGDYKSSDAFDDDLYDEYKIETKGGGYTPPPPPDPMAEARAMMLLEQERARIAEEQRLAEEERKRVQRERDMETFNTNVGAARNQAYGAATDRFGSMGLDDPRFTNALGIELDRIRSTIPELDPTPANYFGSNIADTVIGQERGIEQRSLRNALNQFAGNGFAMDRIQNTVDDGILAAILGDQYTGASETLLRAKDRGTINDDGYNAGLRILDNQRTAGNARLQDLGGGILEQGRTELRDIASTGFDRANNFDFGDPYSVDQTRTQLDSAYGDFSSGLEGKIYNALGGEQLFNIEDIISRSGTAAGLSNSSSSASNSSLLDALSKRQTERDKQRGVGEQGAF